MTSPRKSATPPAASARTFASYAGRSFAARTGTSRRISRRVTSLRTGELLDAVVDDSRFLDQLTLGQLRPFVRTMLMTEFIDYEAFSGLHARGADDDA